MSAKISALQVATTLSATDSFTILKDGQPDATKNQQITKANALLGVTQDPPAAGNKLRDQAAWVAAGGAAVLNVGTAAGTVASGDAPASAITAHNTAFAHANLPTTAEKQGLTAANPALSTANPVASEDYVDAAIAAIPPISAVPAGSNAQVQFNANGVFGASAGMTYSEAVDSVLSVGVNTGLGRVQIGSSAIEAGTTVNIVATGGLTVNGSPVGGGSSNATQIQDFDVTTTDPVDGNILVYRTAQTAYVLEAKPASGSTPAAADVTFTPGGTVAATNVQAAIAEVALEAVQTTDARLTDARTPLAHAASHASGGSDPVTPAAIGAATAAQGTLADTSVQPGDDAADLGSGAATATHILTADGVGGASWVVPPAGGSGHVIYDEATPLAQRANLRFEGAGVTATDTGGDTVVMVPGGGSASLTPIATYTIQGNTTLTESAGILTIPLDGKSYTYTLPSDTAATTLALSGVPTPPVCGDVTIVLKQAASGGPHTVAYPAAWNWPNGAEIQISTTANSRMRLTISSDALGVIDASAEWMS